MKLHEYQGKELLRKHGVSTLAGGPCAVGIRGGTPREHAVQREEREKQEGYLGCEEHLN